MNSHHSSFTISLFDHILVSVKVDSTSPAHPHKILLELNQCTPIKLSTGDHQKEGKTTSKEIIQVNITATVGTFDALKQEPGLERLSHLLFIQGAILVCCC